MKKLITYHLLMFLALSTIPNTSHCAQPTPSETFIFGFKVGFITCAAAYAVYSLANASSEATTRMRAADRRLAEQIQISDEQLERTRARTQQAQEATRNGDHQRAQTLLVEELFQNVDPRMQQLAREGRLSHTSFLQAMLAQGLLRNR